MSDLANAIRDAVNQGAKVINISGGYEGGSFPYLQDAVEYAERKGVVIVAAAGNSGAKAVNSQTRKSPDHYPAYYSTVIGAGSISMNGRVSDFSSVGKMVDIAAPGDGIYVLNGDSSNTGGQSMARVWSGTSFAAPIVSAAVVLLLQKEPNLMPSQVRGRLYNTANKKNVDGVRNDTLGHGVLDYTRALGVGPVTEWPIRRLAGPSRIETAIELSKASFSNGKASNIVIARSEDYPDALVSGSFAKRMNASLLINPKSELHPAVKTEIDRVLGKDGTIYIAGGLAVISKNVEDQIKSMGRKVIRLACSDRIETALKLAAESIHRGEIKRVYLSDGTNFVPSIVTAAVAAKEDALHILIDPGFTSDSVKKFLSSNSVHQNCVLVAAKPVNSNPYGCSDSIISDDPERLSSDVVMRFGQEYSSVGFSSSDEFPDGLTGGLHIARNNGVMLMTKSSLMAIRKYDAYRIISDKWKAGKDFTVFVCGGVEVVPNSTIEHYY